MMRRQQFQHASVLAIRKILKEKSTDGKSIDIYCQDPAYIEGDIVLLARHGMTVVKDGRGHQVGWTLIDDNTLVFDINTVFRLYALMGE
jgi:hypothetical protein